MNDKTDFTEASGPDRATQIASAADIAQEMLDRLAEQKPATMPQTRAAANALAGLAALLEQLVKAGGIELYAGALHFEPQMESLRGEVQKWLLDFLQTAPNLWQKLVEAEQRNQIDRADYYARTIVEEAVIIVAVGNRPSIRATLVNFAVGDETKIVLKAPADDDTLLALNQSRGGIVRVISVAASDMMGGDNPQPDPDQPGLPIDEGGDDPVDAPPDGDGHGNDDPDGEKPEED